MVVDRFELIERAWRFGRADGETYAPQMRLNADGRIACYRNDKEHRWDVRDNALVLLDRAGRATTVFGAPTRDGDRLAFEGACLLERHTIHSLIETDRIERAPDRKLRVQPRSRAVATGRRNLVVVHAGTAACHPAWTRDVSDDDRNWDLCLSWHGLAHGFPDDASAAHHVVQDGMTKWPAMHRLLHDTSVLSHYDQVMLADDDVDLAWSGINRAFGIARDCDLLLSQPSFSEDADVAHDIARHRPGHSLRFTSFVSQRMPIFAAEALRICAPTFGLEQAGDILGHLWISLLACAENRVGVIDAVAAVDRRLPGRSDGLAQAREERRPLLDSFGIHERFDTYGVLSI